MHLKAVAFLRPTRSTIATLRRELQRPRYGEFHLYFTNAITDSLLEEVADADEKEVVWSSEIVLLILHVCKA
mgnify:CR=1 FL=1